MPSRALCKRSLKKTQCIFTQANTVGKDTPDMNQNWRAGITAATLITLGLATGIYLAWREATPAEAITCHPGELAWLPDNFTHDANRTRTAPLRITLNPYNPNGAPYPETTMEDWRSDVAVNWTHLILSAQTLGLDIGVLPGNVSGGDILVQHEKFPYTGRAGEYHNTEIPLSGGKHSSIIVTWGEPEVPLELVVLHELLHALGLRHLELEGNLLVSEGHLNLNLVQCQVDWLNHVHRK